MKMKLKQIKKHSSLPSDGLTRKIIQGENLHVLDLLTADYKGKVKCIYIDPPYNNGETTHITMIQFMKSGLWKLRNDLEI
jgi:adenine specific DNA methylase Mod